MPTEQTTTENNTQIKQGLVGIADALKKMSKNSAFENVFKSYHNVGIKVEEISDIKLREAVINGEAEIIHIGKMDYIVINTPYNHEKINNTDSSVDNLLFSNSIKNSYAIIDTNNASLLTDEVYSQVFYMLKDCTLAKEKEADVLKNEIMETFVPSTIEKRLIGEKLTVKKISVEGESDKQAKIFQCQLVVNTGVSSYSETYSFMLQNGRDATPIPDIAIKEAINENQSEIKMADEGSDVADTTKKIKKAIFEHYSKDYNAAVSGAKNIDIQSIDVKSIFELRMKFSGVEIMLDYGEGKKQACFKTSYLKNDIDKNLSLNKNIHVCNTCKGPISEYDENQIDQKSQEPNLTIEKIHINTDALDPIVPFDNKGNPIFATGCERCLSFCEECGEYHFDYSKRFDYDGVKFAPGRAFIKNLKPDSNCNYCSCQEGVTWVYDDSSKNSDGEYEKVIPLEDIVFVSCANERLATHEDYKAYLKGAESSKNDINRFKAKLAKRYGIKAETVRIVNKAGLQICKMCNGEYSGGLEINREAGVPCCDACKELLEKRHTVTRSDGIIFMRGPKNRIRKYKLTKFGNLKEIVSTESTNAAREKKPKANKKQKKTAKTLKV